MILRRFSLIGAACAAMLGCGTDSTAPAEFGQVTIVVKNPGTGSGSGSASILAFTKVRIILKRSSGATAMDTSIAFPATASELPVTLSLPLTPGTPATGEPVSLSLEYLNAAGTAVFKGGPVTITLVRVGSGQSAQTAVQTPLTYTGPGANATGAIGHGHAHGPGPDSIAAPL